MNSIRKNHTRVLAVDDNPTNLAIIEEIIEDRFQLEFTDSAVDAVPIARRIRPDIILLDIMMPNIDGYENCRRLRAEPTLRHAKIIMVSAKALVQERLTAYEAGANDYITKPFDHLEFIAKLEVYARLKTMEEVDELKTHVFELLGRGMKSPMSSIIAPCELLVAEAEMTLAERRSLARAAYGSARRLQRVIEEAMTLAALRLGRWDVQPESVDLGALSRAVLAQPEEDGPPPEAVLCDIAPGHLSFIDAKETEVVIRTLIGAAWRLAQKQGVVELRANGSPQAVQLEVAINGSHLPADSMCQAFEPFAGRLAGIASTDLRLSIAAEITRAMGGRIEARRHDHEFALRLTLPALASIAAD